jgi:hypothetical protein
MMNIQKIVLYKHNTGKRGGCFSAALLSDFLPQVRISRFDIGPKVSVCGTNAALAQEVHAVALALLRKNGFDPSTITSLRPIEHSFAAEISRTVPSAYAFLFGTRTDYVFLEASESPLAKLFNAMKRSPSEELLKTFNVVKYTSEVFDRHEMIKEVRRQEEHRYPAR